MISKLNNIEIKSNEDINKATKISNNISSIITAAESSYPHLKDYRKNRFTSGFKNTAHNYFRFNLLLSNPDSNIIKTEENKGFLITNSPGEDENNLNGIVKKSLAIQRGDFNEDDASQRMQPSIVPNLSILGNISNRLKGFSNLKIYPSDLLGPSIFINETQVINEDHDKRVLQQSLFFIMHPYINRIYHIFSRDINGYSIDKTKPLPFETEGKSVLSLNFSKKEVSAILIGLIDLTEKVNKEFLDTEQSVK